MKFYGGNCFTANERRDAATRRSKIKYLRRVCYYNEEESRNVGLHHLSSSCSSADPFII